MEKSYKMQQTYFMKEILIHSRSPQKSHPYKILNKINYYIRIMNWSIPKIQSETLLGIQLGFRN